MRVGPEARRGTRRYGLALRAQTVPNRCYVVRSVICAPKSVGGLIRLTEPEERNDLTGRL
jgi:hypothetical protein